MTSLIWVKYITNRLRQFGPLCYVIFNIHKGTNINEKYCKATPTGF